MGKKSSKTKSTNEPPKWAVPHLQGAMGTITNTVNQNQGNLQNLTNNLTGYLPQLGQMAFGQNAGLNAANKYSLDAMGGKYLNNNPYIDGMISATADDVEDRVNSMFAKAGASLGSPHAGVMTKELANAENSMRFSNYGMERGLQSQAAGMIPGLNQAQYAGIMPYLAMTQGAAQMPYTGIQNLGMLGGLAGGYGTQSGQQPGGWGTALAGAAASALPFILSEPEAKTNIKLVRRDPDGLGWYDYAYKRAPDVMLHGVMADEVEKLRPHALGPKLANGWRTVNYAALEAA